MTTFTTIPNSSLEPGKPIRSIDGLALRDNPIAIAEGSPGAPQIQTNALISGERMNTANVLNSTAGLTPGGVGTYAVAWNLSTTALSVGNTISGSSLGVNNSSVGVSSPFGPVSNPNPTIGTTQSGTWRALAFVGGREFPGEFYTFYTSLFVRIS